MGEGLKKQDNRISSNNIEDSNKTLYLNQKLTDNWVIVATVTKFPEQDWRIVIGLILKVK